MAGLLIVAAFAVLVRVAVLRRRRVNARNDAASAFGAAFPRPWAGPARLNGRPSLRLPRRIPHPVQILQEDDRAS